MNGEVAVIVAVGSDMAIGRGGDLIWSLPGDLPRFRRLTTGHPVIMGRRTWFTLQRRPLPGRLNIVISRDAAFSPEGAVKVSSPEEALEVAREAGEMPFVIGGGQIYAAMLPYATRMYLTEVDADTPDADTFFPRFDRADWEVVEQSGPMANDLGIEFRFTELRRR